MPVAIYLFLPLECHLLGAGTACPVHTQPQCPVHSKCSIKSPSICRWRNSGPEGESSLSKGLPGGQHSKHQYPALLRPPSGTQSLLSHPRTHKSPGPLFNDQHSLLLHFHLHTNYFKELEQVWGGGWGRDRFPSGARTPGWLPWTRAGGSVRLFNLWAPALHVHTHSKPAAPHT